MTNRQFASHDAVFGFACELAHVQPTKRQASKYRMGIGSAIGKQKAAIQQIDAMSQSNK